MLLIGCLLRGLAEGCWGFEEFCPGDGGLERGAEVFYVNFI